MARFIVLWLIIMVISATGAEMEEKQVIAAERKVGKHDFRSAPAPGEEEVMERNHHHHHHGSFEKSVAGGGVVVGVLAAVFLMAVFCYIRATRGRPSVQPMEMDSKKMQSTSPIVK